MAQAVSELFPGARLAIGPAVQDGFYYDFDLPHPVTADDLGALEERMRRIIAGDFPFVCREVSAQEARRLFAEQAYKLELIDELERAGAPITTYRHDSFEDLCRGPHLRSTGEIPADAFRLTHVSGAYWRGDERRPMLQRIYGTAWGSREALDEYLWRIEEAKRRDHRRLGRDLDLFSISEAVGPGLILWHPRGAVLRQVIEDYLRRAADENGYQWVVTPHVGRSVLWETSGHLGFFREEMYPGMEGDGTTYYVKPMNCPFHAEIYKSRPRSYRDLPLRLAENGTVYRYERSGVLHGLARTRGFTTDDGHIFCRPDQIDDEIEAAIRFVLSVLQAFGLGDFSAELSTRPEKAVGDEADWERATAALRRAAERQGLTWRLDEGGGAFYGPKLSLKLRDAIGREWQCGTIQFDFNLPQRFGLEFVGDDGRPHQPYMVHRALMGSIERFVGVLIEHYAGAVPLWLAPVQAVVIPVSAERHSAYAREVVSRLRSAGFRAEVDDGNERMQAKIRQAQLQKVPAMLVVGSREQESGAVSVRLRSGQDLGSMPLDELLNRLRAENILSSSAPTLEDGTHWTSRCC
jgi:threonyl-tRNA synthetase